ncbi:MAG: methyl-accepting chemotaxis sensory transducer with Cache sensor, partial [Clostridia bacterium]|nr:methyl-accepting chemotaxis sensory transducer with Cache sensor [Clostridia bacterium]
MEKINIHSFKVKLIISMMLIFLIPILTISIVIDMQMKSQLERDFIKSTTNEISQVDTTITTFFDDIKENVQLLSINETLEKADETIANYLNNPSDDTNMTPSTNGGIETQIYNEFEKIAKTHLKYRYVWMAGEKGTYIQYPESTITKNYDPRQQIFYTTGVSNKGNVMVTDPYYYEADKIFVVSVVSSFNDLNNQLAGVAGIDVGLNGMTDLIKEMKIGKSGYVILTDAYGVIMAHPTNSELNSKNISELKIKGIEDITKLTKNDFDTIVDGKASLVNVYSSEKTGWK